MSRKKTIAGNWKMNLTVKQSCELVRDIHDRIKNKKVESQTEVVVAPTHLSLYAVMIELRNLSSPIRVASQNVCYHDDGAYTGEVSVSMLKDIGVPYCIVGHSERRALFAETDDVINFKVVKLLDAGITPILCVGETLSEREAGRWQEVVSRQCRLGLETLSPEQAGKVVIAYEPVWAIGTGVSASPKQAQEVHRFIREELQSFVSNPEAVTLLYGGSVNAKNSDDLFAQEDIDGGLVGGASLKPEAFISIISSLSS